MSDRDLGVAMDMLENHPTFVFYAPEVKAELIAALIAKAREEERERWFSVRPCLLADCSIHRNQAIVCVEVGLKGIGAYDYYLCPDCIDRTPPDIAAAIRARGEEESRE